MLNSRRESLSPWISACLLDIYFTNTCPRCLVSGVCWVTDSNRQHSSTLCLSLFSTGASLKVNVGPTHTNATSRTHPSFCLQTRLAGTRGHGDTGTRIESYCRPQPRCNCWLTEQRNQSRETKRPGHVETRRNQIDPRESNTRTKRVSTTTAMNGDAQRAVVTSRGGISGRAFANGGRSTKKHEREKTKTTTRQTKRCRIQLSTPTQTCSVDSTVTKKQIRRGVGRRMEVEGGSCSSSVLLLFKCGSRRFFFLSPRKNYRSRDTRGNDDKRTTSAERSRREDKESQRREDK